jgi:hypothetical protein
MDEAAFNELLKRAAPIVTYYQKLKAWDGGCALPAKPSQGEQDDFCRAYTKAKTTDSSKEKGT